MKKTCLLSYLILTVLAALLAGKSARAQEDVTTVSDSALSRPIRPPVPFNHDQHNETAQIEECSVCHHVYENGQLVEDDSSEGTECSECHAADDAHNAMTLIKIYHAQCKGCHQKSNAGPIMCSECHCRP